MMRSEASLMTLPASETTLTMVYRYGENDPWLLRDVELSIAPGCFVALIGPSGGGDRVKNNLSLLKVGLF